MTFKNSLGSLLFVLTSRGDVAENVLLETFKLVQPNK